MGQEVEMGWEVETGQVSLLEMCLAMGAEDDRRTQEGCRSWLPCEWGPQFEGWLKAAREMSRDY